MKTIRVNQNDAPAELLQGLKRIEAEFPARFDPDGGIRLSFLKAGADDLPGWRLEPGREEGRIVYRRPVDAFRALGCLWGSEKFGEQCGREESPRLDLTGVMLDVSRNGVLTPEAAGSLFCRFALMGVDTVLLYTEDTYPLENEPFFGYMRGAYTVEELRDLKRCAASLGIEMIPCIQTLAHLEQVLQWPAYWDIRDTERVLLAGDERTYRLIGKMLDTMIEVFGPGRIHLGMDEAAGIGNGNYRKKFGAKPPFDILQDHLQRVERMCRDRGLRPLIWSDMYFRLGSPEHDYYDWDAETPANATARTPENVDFVYWDYYHTDSAFYQEWIDRHRAMGKDPVVAAGTWSWNRLWAALPFAFEQIDACMEGVRLKNIREVFLTSWGDDGAECDPFSILPAVQRFAEHVWRGEVDGERLAHHFYGSCGSDFHAWVRAADVDRAGRDREGVEAHSNLGKLLLWQDPLLPLFDPLVETDRFPSFFRDLAEELERAGGKNRHSARLAFPAALARVLERKSILGDSLRRAYASGDRKRMENFLQSDFPEMVERVRNLWKTHRRMWLETYKPFGLEGIERRYGGLLLRLESATERLQEYLAGRCESLPELESTFLRIGTDSGLPFDNHRYTRAATPSWIK